jgi:hypothetical protein
MTGQRKTALTGVKNQPAFPYRGSRLMAWLAAGLLAWLLAACGLTTPTLLPTLTPTHSQPSLTPSLTPVWFPVTATFTPYPTITPAGPTPDPRPGIGTLILEDDFTDPSAWSSQPSENGSAAFGQAELTLIARAKRTYMYSVRTRPQLGNFFAEVTANPVFCRGMDEYGLLVRSVSPANTYRFSVSCDGQARLDRIYEGQAAAVVVWQFNPGIPPGGPSIIRLSVWASGDTLRFFANDTQVLEGKDPKLPAGSLGVFIRSASDETLTVNFSELKVYELAGVSQPPKLTPTPLKTPTP